MSENGKIDVYKPVRIVGVIGVIAAVTAAVLFMVMTVKYVQDFINTPDKVTIIRESPLPSGAVMVIFAGDRRKKAMALSTAEGGEVEGAPSMFKRFNRC